MRFGSFMAEDAVRELALGTRRTCYIAKAPESGYGRPHD